LLLGAKPAQEAHHVIGAGMEGTATCVTEGDLVGSGRGRTPRSEPRVVRATETRGANEESERLIVVMSGSGVSKQGHRNGREAHGNAGRAKGLQSRREVGRTMSTLPSEVSLPDYGLSTKTRDRVRLTETAPVARAGASFFRSRSQTDRKEGIHVERSEAHSQDAATVAPFLDWG